MEKIKAFLKSLVVKIVSGIITTLVVNWGVDKITKFNILEFCFNKIVELIKLILNLLTIQIQLWIYILVLVFVIIAARIYSKIREENGKNQVPDFLKYCEDKYKGRVKFTWEYRKGYDGKYMLENFTPICDCGCQLNEEKRMGNMYYGIAQYICPKCEREYGNILTSKEMESFEKILVSNINSGEYKKIIENRKGE